MKQKSIILIIGSILILFSCNHSLNQNKSEANSSDTSLVNEEQAETENLSGDVFSVPTELRQFIPEHHFVLDTAIGDLNLDNIPDVILVLKNDKETRLSDMDGLSEKRPLLILIRDSNNELHLAGRNDNTVYCLGCGGLWGDPYMDIAVKNGYFSVEHYGGSAWRWTRIITYKYSKEENAWFLHKDGSEEFYINEPEKVISNIKTSKDFGKVKFEDFDINME
ncbi:MAG: hypothetical protein PHT69_16175 [Bacteroidales bacterium]|nr:hypothetical protein [Bacteroidales bacterium]